MDEKKRKEIVKSLDGRILMALSPDKEYGIDNLLNDTIDLTEKAVRGECDSPSTPSLDKLNNEFDLGRRSERVVWKAALEKVMPCSLRPFCSERDPEQKKAWCISCRWRQSIIKEAGL